MDPLSVGASIAGLLSAAGAVTRILGPYVSAARDTPKIATQVNAEVQAASIILSALQSLGQNMTSISIQRATLIQVDQIVAVLTDGVLIFSELEASVGSLPLGESSLTRLALRSRLQWARKETEFVGILARLQGFKLSIALILSILQSDSTNRAEQFQGELTTNFNELLENSRDIARRLMNLEDAFDAQTMVSRRRSVAPSINDGSSLTSEDQSRPLIVSQSNEDGGSRETAQDSATSNSELKSGFDFEDDLEASRPYRRAIRESMDFSFRSSIAGSHAWSVFSGLSLGDISVLSVIALPVYADEITNARHYTFGSQQLESLPLSTLPEAPSETKNLLRDCLEIEIKLSQIDTFRELFEEERGISDIYWIYAEYSPKEEQAGPNLQHPFRTLQRVFRKGTPLVMLFNVWAEHGKTLEMPTWHYASYSDNPSKVAILRAIEAFRGMGAIGAQEMTVTDVIGSDIGFLKVISLIQYILATNTALFQSIDVGDALAKKASSYGLNRWRWKILDILALERQFVDELRMVPEYERQLLQYSLLTGDEAHLVFTPLRKMAEVQLQFLLEAEINLGNPLEHQTWAETFENWSRHADLLGALVANEPRSRKILRGKVPQNPSLLSTVSRCMDIITRPRLYADTKESLAQAIQVHYLDCFNDYQLTSPLTNLRKLEGIVQQVQEEVQRVVSLEILVDVSSDLRHRVDDWKGFDVDTFGRLLLYEPYVHVVRASERVTGYKVRGYLFDEILILAKEVHPKPPRFRGRTKQETPNQDIKLQIKGRVFFSNVTGVVPSSTAGSTWRSCRLFYEGASGQENFEMQFPTSATAEAWIKGLKDAAAAAAKRAKAGDSAVVSEF